jgi:hypothetical protein
MVIQGREKFKRSRQWESLFTLKGQSIGHLTNPKTSYPSKCKKEFVKDDQTGNLP